MTQTVVTTTGTYRLEAAGTWRTGALAVVPLVDEWTAAAPADARAESLTPHVTARLRDGILVLAGRVELAWPSLDTAAQQATVRILRPGSAQTVTIDVPAGSAVPFTAPPLALDAATIALVGSVTRAAFPYTGIGGASVAVTGVSGDVVALSTPLAAAHPAGSTIRERALGAAAATILAEPATGGTRVLRLASTAGLAAGTVLEVGTGLVVVDGVLGAGYAALRLPLAASAPAGSPVTPRPLGAVGADTALTRAARAGDGVLPVAAPLAGSVLELVDGASTEYCPTTVTADGAGRWRLAGVRGIPAVAVTVSASGFVTDGPRTSPLVPRDPFVIDTALRT